MFLGIAGYVAAYVAKEGLNIEAIRLGAIHIPLNIAVPPFTPELAILAGVLAAAILGYVAGLLAIRRQGIYFAMITLALAQMVYFFCLQAARTGYRPCRAANFSV